MAEQVEVFRVYNKTNCSLFCGDKLFLYKNFLITNGLIKLFIHIHIYIFLPLYLKLDA